MRKNIKLFVVMLVSIVLLISLSGCQFLDIMGKDTEKQLKGLKVTIQTYDADGLPIDTIKGVSGNISRDTKFDMKNEDGKTTKTSSVLNITIGGKQVTHVGSSLIMYEQGLNDVMNELPKQVTVNNNDRSTPFINTIVNHYNNFFSGKSRIILIRSQLGKPIATFAGNSVSYWETQIPNSTGLVIDGKYLLVYRCDFTMYDTSLIR